MCSREVWGPGMEAAVWFGSSGVGRCKQCLEAGKILVWTNYEPLALGSWSALNCRSERQRKRDWDTERMFDYLLITTTACFMLQINTTCELMHKYELLLWNSQVDVFTHCTLNKIKNNCNRFYLTFNKSIIKKNGKPKRQEQMNNMTCWLL